MYMTFLYLAFKITKKTFFVKIEVCGKVVRFSHIGENVKENLINYGIDFIFDLISLLFKYMKNDFLGILKAKYQNGHI